MSIVKKCPNLKKCEKDAILNLVLKYKKIVEDKRTDSTCMNEKCMVWQKITDEFNSSAMYKRSVQQIKSFYKNAKCTLKKTLAHEKKERLKTGGGVIEGVKENTDVNTSLLEIVSQEVTPLKNDFDSSAEYFEFEEISNVDKEATINETETIVEKESTTENVEEKTDEIETPNTNKSKSWSRKRPNFSDIKKYVNDFSELKKAKMETEVLKNKKKMEMYEAKTELLRLQIAELRNKK